MKDGELCHFPDLSAPVDEKCILSSVITEGRRPRQQGQRAEPGQRRRRLRRAPCRNGSRLSHRRLRVHLEVQVSML